jgi:hypothetical protein
MIHGWKRNPLLAHLNPFLLKVWTEKVFVLISLGFIPRGLPRVVIPAKAGIQEFKLDAGSCPA